MTLDCTHKYTRHSTAAHAIAGDAVIDGITVEYERSGPTRAVAICRFVDGRGRLWANSSDPAILHAAVTEELVGTSVSVVGGEFSR